MAADTNATNEPRVYGCWRRPGGGGLFGLSRPATYAGIGFVIFSIVVIVAAGPIPGFSLMIAGLAVIVAISLPLAHGRTVVQSLTPRVMFRLDALSGDTRHRGGPLTTSGTYALPGLAATSRLSEGRDAQGRPFAVISYPKRHHHTIAFAAFPDGDALVDDDQVEVWVARWGLWLAALGDEPGLVAASVVVESAPDTGERLRRELAATTTPGAPAVSRAMLGEIADTYPTGSATVNATVTLTFRSVRGQYHEDTIRDLAGRVAHFAGDLPAAGAGAARPMTAQELCERIRSAYDPAAQEAFDDARSRGEPADLSWGDVGPAATDAEYGRYKHDGSVSVTWAMTAPPRGSVPSDVLARLLRPHPDIARKRVALLYRPLDSARAARVVDNDKRDANATVRNSKSPTERMYAEQAAALAAAKAEAAGAGVTNFALLITATATDPRKLPTVRRVIGQLAPTARLQIRPLYGAQEAAFTAALPLGVVLGAHSARQPSTEPDEQEENDDYRRGFQAGQEAAE